MPTAERLLRLYPRAWRERYGEELLALVGPETLDGQQVIDIVSGAIDAWLSADVRKATGDPTMLRSMMGCGQMAVRFTRRDSWIGAGVLLGATVLFCAAGIAARRSGWPVSGEILKSLAFPGSVVLSMPFTFLKGQPWKAQLVTVLGMLSLILAAGWVASLL